MHGDAVHILEQLLIERLYVAVVGDVLVGDGHLPAAYACADVAHAVVVAYCLVLVVWVALAGLGGIPQYFAGGIGVRADERSAA